jgi:transcriptional regulator with XRE-family HTH domain
MQRKKTAKQPATTWSPRARFRYVLDAFFGGSQSALASKLGCSQSVVSKVVAGRQQPGAQLLLALASLHGVTRKWALLGKGPPPDPDYAATTELSLPVVEDLVVPIHRQARQGAAEFRLVSAAEFSTTRLFLRASAKSIPHGLLGSEFRHGDLLIVETNASLWKHEPNRLDGKVCLVQLPASTSPCVNVTRIAVGNPASGNPVSLAMLDPPMAARKPSERNLRHVDVPTQEQVARSQRPERTDACAKARQSFASTAEVALEQIVGQILQLVRIL